MLGLLKRFRELVLVAIMLTVPLAVYFSHAKEPIELSALDRAILRATSPVERALSWVISGALKRWNHYVALRGIDDRAREMAGELRLLKLDHGQVAELRQENRRLAGLLAFAESNAERTYVGARVIGMRLDPKGMQILTLDRGEESGIARAMPVVVPDGVVGRIHGVYGRAADVLLLTDPNSSIASRVERSRARANVRGVGGPDRCRLEYALRSEDMIEGDWLVTAGTDGIFPRGLRVGKLTQIRRSSQGLYQNAEVIPAVDVTKVEEVLVITSSERPPVEQPAARAPAP